MPRRKRPAVADNNGTVSESASSKPTTTKRPRHGTSNSSRSSSRNAAPAPPPPPDPVVLPFSHKRCMMWFTEFTTENPELIEPVGMEKFCEDIGVEPENIVMLCLAYTLNAENMGFFRQSEWIKGMTELQCDSIRKLQLKLDYLRCLLKEPVTFKAIYRYAFDFARDPNQRSMDTATAKDMLALLLGKSWCLFSSFSLFLEQSKYRVINKDQWCNVLEFSRQVLPNLSNYDEDGAWPVMLDEFVDWYREQNPNLVAPLAASSSSSQSAMS